MSKRFLFGVVLSILVACFSCKRSIKKKEEPPEVMMVFPSSDSLPENLLRIYIQFSKPMKTMGNLEKIKLIDQKGNEIKNVFFNNVYELWNKEQTQLTLILDPARVKTGLVAHEALGYALKQKRNYTLIIENLEDVNHQKMKGRFEKKFVVTRTDSIAPNKEKWKVVLPKVNSKNALQIQFSEMLDYSSLLQRLIITNSEKEVIKGEVSILKNETVWLFQPYKNWEKGSYTIHINSRLEDPAGNNLNGLFDHKIGSLKNEYEGKIETISFTIEY